jgi:hypothetical protein
VSEQGDYERLLEKRIRFLLSPVIAVCLMIGLAFMACDFAAVGEPAAVAWVGVGEAAILVNIIARWRLQARLGRLRRGARVDLSASSGRGV